VTTGGSDPSDGRDDALRLVVLSGVVVAVAAGLARGLWVPNLHNALLALAFASVGVYVLHQQPRNRCGWAFLATGAVEAVMFLGRQIGHDPGSGTSPWWGWLGVWPLVVGLALVTWSVVLFPDGSLPSPRWRWPVRVGAGVTVALAVLAALWPVGDAAAGILTPPPFALSGGDAAEVVWDVLARPTYVIFQVAWLVAVVVRWRRSGAVVRRQLTLVGIAAAVSLVALAGGLVAQGKPTAGLLAACLVPVAAGWAIVHAQFFASHSALTWLLRRGGDDAALPAELAEAIGETLVAQEVVVWAQRGDRYHAVGIWPEPVEEVVPINRRDDDGFAADRPNREVRTVARGDEGLGVIVVDRAHPLSRHDHGLLDGFCGQAALVLEHLATSSTPPGRTSSHQLDRLTPRELEVLDLMAQGLTNAAICERLHLSIKTVEPAVSSIFTKLDLPPGHKSNRRVLAVLAYVDGPSTPGTGRVHPADARSPVFPVPGVGSNPHAL
jgi:DNA-binding CsgD family transcriptional regulator